MRKLFAAAAGAALVLTLARCGGGGGGAAAPSPDTGAVEGHILAAVGALTLAPRTHAALDAMPPGYAPLPGATVTVSGTPRSAATGDNGFFRITGVETGARTLLVTKHGFQPLSIPVTVTKDRTATIGDDDYRPMELATSGGIQASSTPAGAAVSIDGKASGLVTPATLTGVAVGVHSVSVALQGYETPEPVQVEVEADQTAQVEFEFPVPNEPPESDRIVLIEYFLGVGCPACSWSAPNIERYMGELGPEQALLIEYHVYQPYATSKTMNLATSYGVSAVPTMFINGVSNSYHSGAYETYKGWIEPSLGQTSSIAVTVEKTVNPSVVEARITVTNNGDEPLAGAELMAVAVERRDETYFVSWARDIMTRRNMESLPAGGSVSYELTSVQLANLDAQEISVFAWVRLDGVVLQAGSD